MRIATLIAAAALILAVPAQAKMPWVKKSQELGHAEIKDCKACHAVMPAKKGTELTERGKFLVDTKVAKKATEVDLAWLKDYKGK
jgi:cytochrome c2